MHVELPLLTRCCICLPLRYGLIVWGYIRMIISALIVSGLSILFYGFLGMFLFSKAGILLIHLSILICLIFLGLADVILNIIFVIGGHTKNVRFLKAYLTYSMVLCVLTMILGAVTTIYSWNIFKHEGNMFQVWVILFDMGLLIAQTVVQGYVILLVRSEIIKLKSNCHFRFVNNAAEYQCSMDYNSEVLAASNVPETIDRYCEKDILDKETV